MTDESDTMKDVSHTNPNTGRPFGDAVAFRRGAVAADGGERPEEPRSSSETRSDGGEAESEDDTMGEVSHTAPTSDNHSAQRAFERGTEGRDETV